MGNMFKQEIKRLWIPLAAIAFMILVLFLSRNADVITRRFGIVFFGSIICVTLLYLCIGVARDIEDLRVERWRMKRRAEKTYAVERSHFEEIAESAIRYQRMLACDVELPSGSVVEFTVDEILEEVKEREK